MASRQHAASRRCLTTLFHDKDWLANFSAAFAATGSGTPSDRDAERARDELGRPDAPPLDFVFTVRDHAANEICLVFPAQPMMPLGHPVPPALGGNAASKSRELSWRLSFCWVEGSVFMLSLPFSTLHRFSLKKEINNIGRPMNFGSTAVTWSNRPASVYPKLPIFPNPVTIYNAGTTPPQHRTVVLKSAGSPRGGIAVRLPESNAARTLRQEPREPDGDDKDRPQTDPRGQWREEKQTL
jgi:hypothetical protein